MPSSILPGSQFFGAVLFTGNGIEVEKSFFNFFWEKKSRKCLL